MHDKRRPSGTLPGNGAQSHDKLPLFLHFIAPSSPALKVPRPHFNVRQINDDVKNCCGTAENCQCRAVHSHLETALEKLKRVFKNAAAVPSHSAINDSKKFPVFHLKTHTLIHSHAKPRQIHGS